MIRFLSHLLLPQESNNHRAKILHHTSLSLIVTLLFLANVAIFVLKKDAPSVLGTSTSVSAYQLLQLTNQDRSQAGVGPLMLNDILSIAAENKAQDMFAKNYWAHFSPEGKSPWQFIRDAGYQYVYAGENLARGF